MNRLERLFQKYPEIPRNIVLKEDVLRAGIRYTPLLSEVGLRLHRLLERPRDGPARLPLPPVQRPGYPLRLPAADGEEGTGVADGRGALRGTQYRAHVVRRLKSHVKDPTNSSKWT